MTNFELQKEKCRQLCREFDPKGKDFDAYTCWEAGCYEVDEQCFGDPNDEDFEEVLCCDAPEDYVCPLYAIHSTNQHNFNC